MLDEITKDLDKQDELIKEKIKNSSERKNNLVKEVKSDKQKVDEYVADELCGYPNTTQLWLDLAEGFHNLWSKKTFDEFDEKTSFLHISGDQDKVNNDGTQAENIHNLLIESGLKSELKIFKGIRHEPFQEKKGRKFLILF